MRKLNLSPKWIVAVSLVVVLVMLALAFVFCMPKSDRPKKEEAREEIRAVEEMLEFEIIPPEVKDDGLYRAIYRLMRSEPNLHHVLEIGSSSGQGSTEAFVHGIRDRPADWERPNLYCMEVAKLRFDALKKNYENDSFVQAYHASSVSLDYFPSAQEVTDFYTSHDSALRAYSLETVLSWLEKDKQYLLQHAKDIPQNGIEIIQKQHGIKHFDAVLIDGSEFTGSVELKWIYGAKYILLDDINAFKCFHAYHRLLHDKQNYELVEENWKVRHGYAVFRRITM